MSGGKPPPKDDLVARLTERVAVLERRLGVDGTPAKRRCSGCGSSDRPLTMTHHSPGPGHNVEIRPKCGPCTKSGTTSSPSAPPSSSASSSGRR